MTANLAQIKTSMQYAYRAGNIGRLRTLLASLRRATGNASVDIAEVRRLHRSGKVLVYQLEHPEEDMRSVRRHI